MADLVPENYPAIVREEAGRIGAFWACPIKVVIRDQAPSYDWEVVTMPRFIANNDPETIRALLLHEIGHRTISPGTPDRLAWWHVLALLRGLPSPMVFVNIACDLIVDNWYLEHPLWGESYRLAELNNLSTYSQRPTASFWMRRFLYDCYSILLKNPDGKATHESDSLAGKAVAALLYDHGPADVRIERFFSIIRNHLDRHPEVQSAFEPTELLLGTPIGHTLPDDFDVSRFIQRMRSRAGVIPESTIAAACGRSLLKRIKSRIRVLESLIRVEDKVRKIVSVKKTRRLESTNLWRWGESSRYLETLKSIERGGILIPGVTTLQNRYARSVEPEKNMPQICLIVDNSGSTSGCVIDNELDAAVSLIESARLLKRPLAALVFGSGNVAAIKMGFEYDKTLDLFAGLEGQSGGTEICPSLDLAIAMHRPPHQLATVIFSDGHIFDIHKAVPRLSRLAAMGPVLFFVSAQRINSKLLIVLRKISPSPRVVVHDVNTPLIDEALRILL